MLSPHPFQHEYFRQHEQDSCAGGKFSKGTVLRDSPPEKKKPWWEVSTDLLPKNEGLQKCYKTAPWAPLTAVAKPASALCASKPRPRRFDFLPFFLSDFLSV